MKESETRIPVVQEELAIGKRVVETGKGVRINKTVSQRAQLVDQPLASDEVVVERVRVVVVRSEQVAVEPIDEPRSTSK